MPTTTDKPRSRPVAIREGRYRGTRVYFVALTKGHEVIVEPRDWHRVAEQYGTRWAAAVSRGHVYARKSVTHPDGTIRMASLARVMTEARPDERVVTDNGNALDLRRSNLSRKRFVGKVAQRRREQDTERQQPRAEKAEA